MSSRKARDIAAALSAKGFHTADTHHEFYWYYFEGLKTSVFTKLSRDYRDYGDDLLGLMARQLRLRRKDLDRLLDCPMDAAAYRAHLVAGGHVKTKAQREQAAPKPKPPAGTKR